MNERVSDKGYCGTVRLQEWRERKKERASARARLWLKVWDEPGEKWGDRHSKRAWGPAGVLNSVEVGRGFHRGNINCDAELLYWLGRVHSDFNTHPRLRETNKIEQKNILNELKIKKTPTQGHRDPNSAALLASAQEEIQNTCTWKHTDTHKLRLHTVYMLRINCERDTIDSEKSV